MRIVEARYDRLTTQINAPCIPPGGSFDIGGVSDGRDAISPHQHGFGFGSSIHGQKRRAEVQAIAFQRTLPLN